MGRKLGSKNKTQKPKGKPVTQKAKVKTITERQAQNQVVNVNVTPQRRKRRITRPKQEVKTPLSNTLGLTRPSSQNIGFHPRGLINNEPQQPTIMQTIQAPPDPRLDKLDKRTKKLKEYLKNKGDTQQNPINVNSPTLQNMLTTPNNIATADIFSDVMEPKKLNFEEAKPKKGFFSKLYDTSLFSPKKNTYEQQVNKLLGSQ
jgi:hypothetical protein